MSKKLVLFGAGKIGRSFIGRLFSRAGYETVFIDADKEIIAALNKKRTYDIVVKSDDKEEIVKVDKVRGVFASDKEKAIEEIATADILATSVGQNNLSKIASTAAAGIRLKTAKNPKCSIDIILAENMRGASDFFKNELRKYIPCELDIEKSIGLIETSIGKMVPIMPKSVSDKDPLTIYAEPYNTLILDARAFKNPIPEVEGFAPKANMPAWVDRKLFIHNLGHAAAAYYGYAFYPEKIYLYELTAMPDVYQTTRSTMLQAADILLKLYPEEFTKLELIEHIDDLLYRFSNRALGDTVYRVGQDLFRKLGSGDRLVAALKTAVKFNMPYDKILFIIVCALDFGASDEQGNRSEGDARFAHEASAGISHVLSEVCNLEEKDYPDIHKTAKELRKSKAFEYARQTVD